jgi:hypothetical protein
MTGLLVLVALLVVLAGTHTVAFTVGRRHAARASRTRAAAGQRQLTDVVRAARRAVAADPSLPNDSALRRQELALALDEYDNARTELDGP